MKQSEVVLLLPDVSRYSMNRRSNVPQIIVIFLFCIRLVELVELGEFNLNQSHMTERDWKLFCVSYLQLALWCSRYDS